MIQYAIKPEFVDRWTDHIEDEYKPVTEEEIRSLSREWNVPVEDLMEQVEEIVPQWVLIDERDGEIFEEPIPSDSKVFAARRLIDAWENLSRTERGHHKLSVVKAIMIGRCVDYDSCEDAIEITDREINLSNGSGHWYSPDEADAIYDGDEMVNDDWFTGCWDAIVNVMDDDTRELIHAAYAPCTNERFLRAYLRIAPADLIVG